MIDNIEVFTHSSIRITSSKVMYFDPFNIKEEFHDADIIFFTHDHYDHFSKDDVKKIIKDDTILVAPSKMEGAVKEIAGDANKVYPVDPGAHYEVDGIEFDTVPAYNNLKPFHPKSAGYVGYIAKADGKRIYVAGDTSLTKEIQEVKCDIALVPVGGFYTMDAKKAAELINLIKPEYAIPTHYGSVSGTKKDAGDEFKKLVQSPVKVVDKIKYFE